MFSSTIKLYILFSQIFFVFLQLHKWSGHSKTHRTYVNVNSIVSNPKYVVLKSR